MVTISVQAFLGNPQPFFLAAISEDKKNHLMSKYQVTQEVLDLAEEMDPSEGAYVEWLVKCIKKDQISKEDTSKIKSLLEKFKRLKNSPLFKENHSADINRYTPDTLFEVLDEFGDSKKQEVKDLRTQGKEGAEICYQDAMWTIYKVTSAREAVVLGSGTNWCTTNPSTADQYLDDGPLWIFHKDGEPYAQLHIESNQLMNRVDRDFRKGKMVRDQGLYDVMEKVQDPAMVHFVDGLLPMVHPSERYLTILKSKGPAVIQQALKSMMIDRYETLEPEIFSLALGEDFISAYLSHFEKRDPEVERIIVDKPAWASVYALYVLRARWIEAEEKILAAKEKISSCALYAVTFSVLDLSSLSQLAKVLPKVKSRNKNIENFLLSYQANNERVDSYVELSLSYMKRASYLIEPLIDRFLSKEFTKRASISYDAKENYSNLAGLLKQRRVINDGLTSLLLSPRFYTDFDFESAKGACEYLIFVKGPKWFPPKGMDFDYSLLDPNIHLVKLVENMEAEKFSNISVSKEVIEKHLDVLEKYLLRNGEWEPRFFVKNDVFTPKLIDKRHDSLYDISEESPESLFIPYAKKYLLPYIEDGSLSLRSDDLELAKAIDLSKLADNPSTSNALIEIVEESLSERGRVTSANLDFARKILEGVSRSPFKIVSLSRYSIYRLMDILRVLEIRWSSFEKWIKKNPPTGSILKQFEKAYRMYLKYAEQPVRKKKAE